MSSVPACKNSNPGRVPLWHATRLLVIALVTIVSAGCGLSSDVSLPALPNAPIRGFNITTTTLSPSVAFDTSSYSATISTFGGVTPLTNCAVTLNVPAGFTMAPLTGMVNPANASQCIISGVISVSPAPPAGGLVVQVVVGAADSSTPALTDTETYTLTIQPGFAINVFVMANGTEGRAYNLPVTTTLGTGGVAPLNAVNGCVLAAHSGPLPTGMTIARNPGNTNQCLFAGTPGAGTAGTYNIAITARDSAATPNVSTFPAAPTTVTLVINPPLTIPAYAPTAGTVNTAGYLFTVPTLGGQAPVTCSGTAPAGLTIGTAANGRDCEITGTPAAAVVNGAVSVTVTDSATATTAAGMTTVGSTLTVNPAATTTTITSDVPDPTATGESYTVSWTVSAVAPAADAPTAKTGNVTVTDGEGNQCVAAVAAGSCTITNPVNTTGLKTVTATYAGDANFTGSNGTTAHTVQGANTTTTITSDNPDPSVTGQAYSVNVTVDVVAPGMGSPTGVVAIDDGLGNTCNATLAAGPGANQSSGSCLLTSTTAGAKTLTANYPGDANFNASSDTEAHTVNQAPTTTAITSDLPDPSPLATAYTVTFTVTAAAPGAGTPTGNVTVDDGDGNTCTATVAAGSCMITSTLAGVKTLTASYAGDADFLGSAGTTSHTVSQGASTTTITSDVPDPTVVGESYLVSFTVTGAGAPTGNVTVDDGDGNTCTATVAVGSCSIISTLAGAKTLTANYAGDANFAASSGTAAHTVNQASTTTTITNALALTGTPTTAGQMYAVNWTVTVNAPGAGTPTGTVTVDDGTGNNCSAAVAAGTCNLASFAVGVVNVTATYNGDANFSGSASAPVPHTVLPAATTTVVTDSLDPTVHGQAYTANVTVTPVAPASGGPTGTVTVSDGTQSCMAVLVPGPTNSTGSCVLNSFPVGAFMLTAVYPGDGNYGPSDNLAAPEPHTVNQANVTVTVNQGVPNPTVPGEAYTVSWTVTVAAPGTLQTSTITGNVTVDDGDGNNCSAAVAVGSCSITSTTAGAKTLTANYDGSADPNFNSGSGTNTHTVNQGATTVTITNAASLAAVDTVTGEVYAVNWTVAINAPATGTLTGTVTVSDGIAGTCTVAVALNTCNIATRAAGGGPKTITVTYNGDANFATSNSTATHTVNKSTTGMGIPNTSPDPSVVGEPYTVTFAAFITDAGAGTLTGTLTADDGEGNTCTATLPTLTCQMIGTSPGTKNLTGSYSGDADFAAIAPSVLATHDVNAADTTTTITSDAPDPSAINAAYTVSWTVTANAPSVAPPPTITGTVTVDDGDGNTCNAPVATGSCMITSTSGGVKTLTANYSGDGNFNASSDTESHTVALSVTVPTIGNMTELRAVTTPAVFTTDSGANLVSCIATPALPAGVTLTPVGTTCELAGTPAAATAGTYIFTVTVNNGTDSGTSGNASLTINPPLAIAPGTPLTNARQNSTYTLAITTSGGQAPRTLTNPTGDGATTLNGGDAECAGMFFSGGQIQGTPTATGVCNFDLSVTDTATTTTPAGTLTTTYQVTVDPAMTIPAVTLKNALRNSPYTSNNISVSNSVSTVTWTVTSGDFSGTAGTGGCTGLTLGATGTTTTITGTGTSAGPSASTSAFCGTGNANGSTFTVQASDAGLGPVGPGSATQTFGFAVLGQFMYVADPGTDSVKVIDVSTDAEVASIAFAGGTDPHSIAITADGSKAFVTLQTTGQFAVISTITNAVVAGPTTFATCTDPRGIDIGKAGAALNVAFVGCGNDTIATIDTTTNTEGAGVTGIPAGNSIRYVAVAPDGATAFASRNSRNALRIVTSTLVATETANVGAAGGTLRGVAVSADSLRVYFADAGNDEVQVRSAAAGLAGVDCVAGGGTDPCPTGAGSTPEGVRLSDGGTLVFVANTGTGAFTAINESATPTVNATTVILAATGPFGVAVAPGTNRVYFTLNAADAVARRNDTNPFASAGANIALSGATTPQGAVAIHIPQ